MKPIEDTGEEEKKAKQSKEVAPPVPVPVAPVERAITITASTFMRSEQLGHLRQGFAVHLQEKGIGGFKTRKEWNEIFQTYRNTPKAPFKR